MIKAIAALTLISVFAGSHQAAATQIVNGSFELPDLTTPDHLFDLAPGDNTINGWQITTGSVDLVTDTCCGTLPADTGNQFVDLVGSQFTGGISQEFTTIVNQAYFLTFAYSHNAGVPTASASVVVTDAADLPLLSTSVIHSAAGWSHFVAQFVASSASTTLTFTNLLGGSNQGVLLDSVSVTATPIPAALPLFASALGGLGFAAWRRKKAAAA
jgi:choice-of-anchor C domain-containing protein